MSYQEEIKLENCMVMTHRVLVELELVDEKTESGIYIPEVSREREQAGAVFGKVVKVGESAFVYGDRRLKETLQPGDIVQFPRYSGLPLLIEGKPHAVINDQDAFLRVRPATI